MTSKRRQWRPERELTADEISERNRLAFETEPDFSQDPDYREVSSAEAKARRDLKRAHLTDRDKVRSLTGRAALSLELVEDLQAIKTQYMDTPPDEPLGPVDEAMPGDVPTAPPWWFKWQGRVWDQHGRDLTRDVQVENGYGPPSPPEPHDSDVSSV